MAETKEITKLYVVTDSETPYDKIGDVDGGMFDDEWLEYYIKNYGSSRLLYRLNSMIANIINVERQIAWNNVRNPECDSVKCN